MRIRKIADNSSMDSYFETMSKFNSKKEEGFAKFAGKEDILDTAAKVTKFKSGLDAIDLARYDDEAQAALKLLMKTDDLARALPKLQADVKVILDEIKAGGKYWDAVADAPDCGQHCFIELTIAFGKNMDDQFRNPDDIFRFMGAVVGEAEGTSDFARHISSATGIPTPPSKLPALIDDYEAAGALKHLPPGAGRTPERAAQMADDARAAEKAAQEARDALKIEEGRQAERARADKEVSDLADEAVEGQHLARQFANKPKVAKEAAKRYAAQIAKDGDVGNVIGSINKMHPDDIADMLKHMEDVRVAGVLGKSPVDQILNGLSDSQRIRVIANSNLADGARWFNKLDPRKRSFLLHQMSRGVWGNKGMMALLSAAVGGGYIYRDELSSLLGFGGGGEDGKGPEQEPKQLPRGPRDPNTGDPDGDEAVTSAADGGAAGGFRSQDLLNSLEDRANAGDRRAAAAFKKSIEQIRRHVYNKQYVIRLNKPFRVPGHGSIRYVYVDSSKAQDYGAVSVAQDALYKYRGKKQWTDNLLAQEPGLASTDFEDYRALLKRVPDPIRAMNSTFEVLLDHAIGSGPGWLPWTGAWRGNQILEGKDFGPDPFGHRRRTGIRNRGRQNMTKKERRRKRQLAEEYAKQAKKHLEFLLKYSQLGKEPDARRVKRFDSIKKFATKAVESTNNDESRDEFRLSKRADDFSKAYYKDAVTDLSNSDQYLRSYFTGLGKLYDERPETPKGDYKSLYNVTDETGVDLVHAAHPKAIVVLDSIGRGGLVENGLEQKRQTHGVALSAPTGNYRANYAWVRDSLTKKSK